MGNFNKKMSNIKDWLTNIFAILLVIATAANAYFQSLPSDGSIDWFELIVGIIAALIAYFTGRNSDGSKKSVPTKV